MEKEELKKFLAIKLASCSGQISGFNSALEVAELKFYTCESGQMYGWTEYVNFQGKALEKGSSEVQVFKAWAEDEWKSFAEIANRKGIVAGMMATCIR